LIYFIDKPCIKFSGWFAKNLIKEIQQKIAKVQFKRKPDAVIPEIVTAATDLAEDVQAAELANYPVQEAD
jgi:hypothetical protein